MTTLVSVSLINRNRSGEYDGVDDPTNRIFCANMVRILNAHGVQHTTENYPGPKTKGFQRTVVFGSAGQYQALIVPDNLDPGYLRQILHDAECGCNGCEIAVKNTEAKFR